jgi:flagellar biosynthetic protein FliR
MDWLTQFDATKVLLFTLVLSRVGGLVVTAPIFNLADTPLQFRALLAAAMALLLTPTQWNVAVPEPGNILHYAVLIGSESFVGACLGLGVMILFSGIEIAGELIGRTGGIMLADVFDPNSDTSVPVFSRLMSLLTLAVFLCMGGHRMVMAALLDTFHTIPLGSCAIPLSITDTMVTLVTQSCVLGVRAAMPITTALLLAGLVLALVGRTLPQLNILALGFGLNALLTFGAVALSLGTAIWLFQDQLQPALEALLDGLHTPLQSQWLSF